MEIINCEQYSPEWWAARIGKPSASKFSEIVTSEGKRSSSWWKRVYILAAELEMGHCEETFQSEAMKRGTEMEGEAREAFSFIHDVDVSQPGCIFRDSRRLWLCSPDGIFGNSGLEIKCPSAGVHKKYCYEGKLPTDYKPQVYGSLWISNELEKWTFFSFHPELKPFEIKITRQDDGYKIYSEALEKFMPEFIRNVAEVAK